MHSMNGFSLTWHMIYSFRFAILEHLLRRLSIFMHFFLWKTSIFYTSGVRSRPVNNEFSLILGSIFFSVEKNCLLFHSCRVWNPPANSNWLLVSQHFLAKYLVTDCYWLSPQSTYRITINGNGYIAFIQ